MKWTAKKLIKALRDYESILETRSSSSELYDIAVSAEKTLMEEIAKIPRGYCQIPDAGYYNLIVKVDKGLWDDVEKRGIDSLIINELKSKNFTMAAIELIKKKLDEDIGYAGIVGMFEKRSATIQAVYDFCVSNYSIEKFLAFCSSLSPSRLEDEARAIDVGLDDGIRIINYFNAIGNHNAAEIVNKSCFKIGRRVSEQETGNQVENGIVNRGNASSSKGNIETREQDEITIGDVVIADVATGGAISDMISGDYGSSFGSDYGSSYSSYDNCGGGSND